MSQTTGLDDPSQVWLRRAVRVKSRPDWGVARVVRWYPAGDGPHERLRIMPAGKRSQKLVNIEDVEVVE